MNTKPTRRQVFSSLRAKLVGLTLFLILFATICLMIGASLLNVSQTRDQNQQRMAVATQSIQRTITRMFSRDAYTLAAFRNKRNVTVMFKGILLSNYVRPEIPAIMSDLGIALNAEQIGFYRPLQDKKQFQLNQYYSRALQGTVVLTRKNGTLEQKLYGKDAKGLVTTSVVDRKAVFPETFPSHSQAYLLECSGGQCLLSMEIPYLSSFDDESFGLKKGEVLGKFLIKKTLEVNLNELDLDMGVSFNLYSLAGQMGQGQVALPDMDLAVPDVAVNQFIERVDLQGERYDSLIVPLNYQDLQLGYLSGSISQETTEQKVQATIRLLLAIALAILVISLVASWFTVTGFVKPIIRIVKLTQRIAAGNLSETLVAKDLARTDEIGVLARAFNSMTSQLNTLVVSLEQRLAELDQTSKALSLSTERLQLATHATHIGIWDWDVVKNELLWEDSMYQLYGIEREEFGGAYDAWARTIHPEDREYAEEEIQAALRGERKYAPEFRIIRTDGAIRYIKADSQTIQDRDGKPLRMIGTNIDITERKQAEEKLRHYKDDLEETVQQRTKELRLARDAAEAANKAKSVFLANMSHELRTPLNAVLGFSQMMRQDTSMSEVHYENLDIINNSGKHLLKLINDVLEIAKIEAGKQQLQIATFDLHALVHEVADMMGLRAQHKGLQLELNKSSEFPHYIKGDEARMRQVLVNLVSNAVKFTGKGTVTLSLRVSDKAPQHLLIEVEDTGPGISEADQLRLFQPFVQLPAGVEHGGTGLGLTIVHQFVQLMSGRLLVESEPGKGSLFRVELPLEEAGEPEVARLVEKRHGVISGLEPGQPVHRILVAEDQRDNQQLLAKLMTDLGLEVKVAENGMQCVQLFKEWKPDLIWMDWRMPVMDGAEAARQIRQLPGGDKVKIVAVTASVFKEQEPELRDAGMDDYVRKPYLFDEIYDSLARQLGMKFTYRTEAPISHISHEQLTPQRLSAIKAEQRDELYAALESLDRPRIDAVISQIASVDAELGQTLSHLAKEFNYPTIIQALMVGEKD